MAKLYRRGAAKNAAVAQKAKASTAATKDKKMLKAIGLWGLKVAMVVGLLGAGMVFAQGWQAGHEKKLASIKAELAKIESEKNSLNSQIDNLGEAAKVYANLARKRQNMDFMIDPVQVRPLMNALRAKHRISKLNIELAPPVKLNVKNFTAKDKQASRYEITMGISGLSDHFIYQFAYELSEMLPGVVQPLSMQMTRQQPLSIEVLSSISRGMKVEAASGQMILNWYGFVLTEDTASGKGGAP